MAARQQLPMAMLLLLLVAARALNGTSSRILHRLHTLHESMPLKLTPCASAGAPNQTFAFQKVHNGTGIASMGRCLDINDFRKTEGSRVDAWSCGYNSGRN